MTATEWSPLRRRLVMSLVTGALFMEILDGTVLTTALPTMARDFGTSPVALAGLVSAYLLTVGVFVPASGWVAERFGTRRVMTLAILAFTAVSALCGVAPNAGVLSVLRVAQGIAGALMVPVGRLVVMHHTPRDRIAATMSALIMPALFAPVIGPPLGGLITQTLGWRWIFWLNLPLGVVALPAAWWLVPDVTAPRRAFDWPGFVLCGLAILVLQVGFDACARAVTVEHVALVAAGLGLLAVAVRWLTHTGAPLIDLRVFAVPTFRLALRGGSVSRMAFGAVPFLLPLMLQAGFGYSAFHAGLYVLTLFLGDLSMKPILTRILARFGYRRVLLVNGVLTAVLTTQFALLAPDTPFAVTAVMLVACGLSRSLQFSSQGSLAYADIGPAAMSHANTLFATMLQLSAALGVTLAATGVHLGVALAPWLPLTGPAAAYRFAFVVLGLVAVAGLLDLRHLPTDAGAGLIDKRLQRAKA